MNFIMNTMINPASNPVHNPLNSRNSISITGVWKWQKLFITDENPNTAPILNISR